MGIKKIAGVLVAFGLVVGGMLILRGSGGDDNVLRICTWSNYYPDAIIEAFSKKTGIKVEFSLMSSNEELFAKMKAGATGFDLIQPSDYMVRQMGQLSMLQPMDHAKLTNLSHLDDFYRNLPYDPGLKVSVPFTWGTTGITLNTDRVPVPAEGVSWALLLNSPDPRHTSLLDDMREVFAAALMKEGKSINTKNPADFAAARTLVEAAKPNILMFSSEPRPLILKEELTVAHSYSTDGMQAHRQDAKFKYFIPKEGGTLWTDNFAIPKTSAKAEMAHQFINYFLDPEVAVALVSENQSATPNKTARERLPDEMKNDPSLYPPAEVLQKMQFLEDLGESMTTLNRIWTELKS